MGNIRIVGAKFFVLNHRITVGRAEIETDLPINDVL